MIKPVVISVNKELILDLNKLDNFVIIFYVNYSNNNTLIEA
jgi:hypothetical protein